MTNGEKHIEKLLNWYKEAVTEDGVCYLNSDDKNTLAYAIKCCKHFEDIKKDVDSWGLREDPSSSEKPNKSVEEKCPCYGCEHFEIKGWSHCKIHEDAYGNLRCADYHKVDQDSGNSENPISSTTKNDLAQERYQDLIEYFGGEDTVLKDRKEFKAWLERVKWHVKRADELAREFGQLKPTTKDCLLVEQIVDEVIEKVMPIKPKDMPSVTPQEPRKGHWYIDERPESDREVVCSNCDQPIFKYHKLDFDYRPKYCPNCGSRNEVEE